MTVQRVDLVNDTTWVDVRFERSGAAHTAVVDDGATSAMNGSLVPRSAPAQR